MFDKLKAVEKRYEEVNELLINRESKKLLKGIKISPNIAITTDFSVTENSDITIIAVPSIAVRETVLRLKDINNPGIVVNVAKGFEPQSLKRLSEVITEEISAPVVVMSGPSHAEEVARNIPTSIVAASDSRAASQVVQDIMSSETLRVYTSGDLKGAELGGAMKNVIAIAAGFCDGLGLGDNTKAALITRGLAEMTRLGVCMGAKEYTFAGLTGIGDLVVTCTSRHSRNNRFGYKVGSGVPIDKALEEVGTVEGYYATEMIYNLSLKYNVELPIINECYNVLYKGKDVLTSVPDLMRRPIRSER